MREQAKDSAKAYMKETLKSSVKRSIKPRLCNCPTIILVLIALIVIFIEAIFSWASICSIVKLLSLCFSFQFKWRIATGIWLILLLLRAIFNRD